MKKPTMKRELALQMVLSSLKEVNFYASPDAASYMAEFGTVVPFEGRADLYKLCVDGRYEFEEVVEYMRNYGK